MGSLAISRDEQVDYCSTRCCGSDQAPDTERLVVGVCGDDQQSCSWARRLDLEE